MQKKLIALAVAGALAAPLAAHADTTIYGKMHVSVDAIDNDNDGTVATPVAEDSSTGISSNSSRIGFKGSEDLGGGLKAVWQYETGVDLAGGDGSLSARNSFLGLAGGFGTVIAGRHDTPYKTVGRKVDLFGDTIGDFRSLSNNGFDTTIAGTDITFASGQDARTNNTVAYITPDMNGLSAALAYVTDVTNDREENNDNDAYSISLNYANGPLYAGLAYQSISEDALGTAAGLGVAGADAEAMRLAASYKVAGIKLNAMFQQDTSMGGVDGVDRDSWLVGAAYGMGNNTFKIQYFMADEIDTDGGSIDNSDGSKLAVGFDHAFSKATTAYVAYAMVDNSEGAAYNVTGSGHGDRGAAGGTELNGDPSAFSLGMVHKF